PSAFIGVGSALIGAFMAFGLAVSHAAGIAVKDDLGRTVELKRPAQRIVSLAPFLTELAFSAGAGARVVGASAFSDYPPEARRLPRVASAAGLSLERLASLHPDLVLAWKDSLHPGEAERIARLGPAVFVAEARTLADVPRLLAAIGTLAGVATDSVSRGYEEKLARLRREYADRPVVPVFLEIWSHPLTTISGKHFMNEALSICRARNVFADLPGVAPEVSWESLYARDPAAIVGVGSAPSESRFRASWEERKALSAVREGRLVFVAPDRLQRPTVRTPDGIEDLCRALDRVRPRFAARGADAKR
ncbi:MAG TPA: cobalamin-binding protein, partial [Usitatibacter sp.]|nr:cobalamin-binding protein [Usitatibacter sp.]